MANFPNHHPFILDIWVVSNYRRVEAIEAALHLLEEIADSRPPSAGQLDQGVAQKNRGRKIVRMGSRCKIGLSNR